jgi:hypothetical protein
MKFPTTPKIAGCIALVAFLCCENSNHKETPKGSRLSDKQLGKFLTDNATDSLYFDNWIYLGQPKDSALANLQSKYNVRYSDTDFYLILPQNSNSILETLAYIKFRDGKVSSFSHDVCELSGNEIGNFMLQLMKYLAKYEGKQEVFIVVEFYGPDVLDPRSPPYFGKTVNLHFGHKYIELFYTDAGNDTHVRIDEGISEIAIEQFQEYREKRAKLLNK